MSVRFDRLEDVMLLRVLGPLEVETGAGLVVIGGGRPRALLTSLVLSARQVVPVSRLIEDVWGADVPNPEQAVHTTVARLRRMLGPDGGRVVTRAPGYVLVVDDEEVDADRFERLVRAARRADPTTSLTMLDEALALWRGPAFGEFASTFASAAAIRLEELRVAALEDRAATMLRLGAAEEAAGEARDLVAQHPYRERPVEILMRALHLAGRTADALEVYRHHRARLTDELGIDPSDELHQLESAILRGEVDRAVAPVAEAPPARSPRATAVRVGLPTRPSTLLGRADELAEVATTLTGSRVLTIVGPPGVGKTRLALEIAHEEVRRGGRVWWLDLVPVRPGNLLDFVAGGLGVERPSGDEATAIGELAAQVEGHRGVVVLDNAEHVLAPVAALAEQLVDAAPGLITLVTSRERLAVDAESVRSLPPLQLPDPGDRDNPAVRLFAERAQLDLDRLPAEDLGLMIEACRRLDGLPLAIELAAARTRSLGLRALVARLEDRLDLLGGGRRTAAARHRTLRSVLDWSGSLLDEQEAALLARLSIFPSGFELDQVETVCTGPGLPRPAIAALLARLVDQSLVQQDGERFRLLETVRTYSAERLADPERLELTARHARDTGDRLAMLVPGVWTSEEARAVAAIGRLEADLVAAWDHAAEHDHRLGVQLAADIYEYAYFRQRLDLLDWATQVAGWEIDHPALPSALATAASAAWAHGQLDLARQHVERAVVLAGPGQPAGALAVDIRADLDMFAGLSEQAVEGYLLAARLFAESGQPTRALSAEVAAGQARSYGPRRPELVAAVPQLLARAKALGNPTTLSFAYFVAGEAWLDHDVDAALDAFDRSVAHGRSVDNRLFVTMSLSSAMVLLARDGSIERAFEVFHEVLQSWEQLRNRAAQWWCLSILVLLLARADRTHEATLLVAAADAARIRNEAFGVMGEQAVAEYNQVAAPLRAQHPDALAEGASMTIAGAAALARRVIDELRAG